MDWWTDRVTLENRWSQIGISEWEKTPKDITRNCEPKLGYAGTVGLG